jgi:polyphenol oxidase
MGQRVASLPGIHPVEASWPPGVGAVYTDRKGGASLPPWGSFNLGDHVGDAPDAVAANRQRLRLALPARPVFLNQVHGWDVACLGPDTPDGTVADACWSDQPGVACTVMVADCLPLLSAAADGRSVAAAHLGWRGLLGSHGHGVLEALCQAWPAARDRAARAAMPVWLGPCIGPEAFEVGPEVRQAFVATDAQAAAYFRPSGSPVANGERWLADLPALTRLRLQGLGFARVAGNDGTPAWCTVAQPRRYFSHRRDAARLGSTGRMAAAIWRL